MSPTSLQIFVPVAEMPSLLKNPAVGDNAALLDAAGLPLNPVRYPRNEIPLFAVLALVVACSAEQPDATQELASGCGPGGYLETRLYGAIDADIDWPAGDIACEGMPRPEGEGARLRFSGPLEDAQNDYTVALIFGIPALTEGAKGDELPTNVTLVREGSGRFFGTADTDGCWTDIDRHELLSAATATYDVTGTVYCVSPLAELNGNASISFTELAFAGRISWQLPE